MPLTSDPPGKPTVYPDSWYLNLVNECVQVAGRIFQAEGYARAAEAIELFKVTLSILELREALRVPRTLRAYVLGLNVPEVREYLNRLRRVTVRGRRPGGLS